MPLQTAKKFRSALVAPMMVSISACGPTRVQLKGLPSAVLVQCKRERRKISKTVVKALWADIEAEGADSGLVVTTSALSPGARTLGTGRGYAIDEPIEPRSDNGSKR
jgi:hypothetical protein